MARPLDRGALDNTLAQTAFESQRGDRRAFEWAVEQEERDVVVAECLRAVVDDFGAACGLVETGEKIGSPVADECKELRGGVIAVDRASGDGGSRAVTGCTVVGVVDAMAGRENETRREKRPGAASGSAAELNRVVVHDEHDGVTVGLRIGPKHDRRRGHSCRLAHALSGARDREKGDGRSDYRVAHFKVPQARRVRLRHTMPRSAKLSARSGFVPRVRAAEGAEATQPPELELAVVVGAVSAEGGVPGAGSVPSGAPMRSVNGASVFALVTPATTTRTSPSLFAGSLAAFASAGFPSSNGTTTPAFRAASVSSEIFEGPSSVPR